MHSLFFAVTASFGQFSCPEPSSTAAHIFDRIFSPHCTVGSKIDNIDFEYLNDSYVSS